MKNILRIILCITMALSFGVNALANISITKYSELSEYHKQLQKEYELAVKDNDVAKQKSLIKEGNIVLDEISELAKSMPTARNPFGTTYSDYFSKSVWITRNDGVALSIYPINLAWPSSQIETAWQFIVDKHSSSSKWKNESVLRKQFWCHVNFAGSMKTPWNIEPYKTSINPFTCN